MNFEEVDPILLRWSETHRIPLSTEYRGEPVRAFDIVGSTGAKCQIWIEAGEGLVVAVWDYRERIEKFAASEDDLFSCLDAALATGRRWLEPSQSAPPT